jgi:hypothetical protein
MHDCAYPPGKKCAGITLQGMGLGPDFAIRLNENARFRAFSLIG